MAHTIPSPGTYGSFPDVVRDLLSFYVEALRSNAITPDRLQTTMERAFGNLFRYEPHEDGPRPWAYGILRNVGHEHARARAREREVFYPGLGQAEGTASPDPTPEDRTWHEEVRPRLLAAIEQLPDRLLAVLVLVTLEGYTHSESAALLQIPIGTVKSRQHEALARLRAALGPKDQYFITVPPAFYAVQRRRERLRKLFDIVLVLGHLCAFATAGILKLTPETAALARAGLFVPPVRISASAAEPGPVPVAPSRATPTTRAAKTNPRTPTNPVDDADPAELGDTTIDPVQPAIDKL